MKQDRRDRIKSLDREVKRYEAKGDDVVVRCLRHFSEQLRRVERKRGDKHECK
ncbi:hypothetical protein L479_02747 [Exiguobacterium sp. S17]|nr:hypothetical protein L479_02747 [Exiguobacterium sp. S17]